MVAAGGDAQPLDTRDFHHSEYLGIEVTQCGDTRIGTRHRRVLRLGNKEIFGQHGFAGIKIPRCRMLVELVNDGNFFVVSQHLVASPSSRTGQ